MSAITEELINDFKGYMGIDETDDIIERKVQAALKGAEAWLYGAVGKSVDTTDARAQELLKLKAEEIYDRDRRSQKEAAAAKCLEQDFVLQLKMELPDEVEEGTDGT